MISRTLILALFALVVILSSSGAAPLGHSSDSQEKGRVPGRRSLGRQFTGKAVTTARVLTAQGANPHGAHSATTGRITKIKCSGLRKRASAWVDLEKPQTLYRGIRVKGKNNNPLQGHPTGWTDKQGDFSNHGGYYMFSSKEEAMFYVNPQVEEVDNQIYSVVTLKWDPSKVPDLKLKQFKGIEKDWEKFVTYNYDAKNAKAARTSPDGTGNLYQVITGPLSTGRAGSYDWCTSAFGKSEQLYQFAVVDKAALKGLTVEKIQDYHFDKKSMEGYAPRENPT